MIMSIVLSLSPRSDAAPLDTAPPPATAQDAAAQQQVAALVDKEKGVSPATPVVVTAAPAKPWVPAQPGEQDTFGKWVSVKPGVGKDALKFKKVAVGDKDNIWALADNNNIYKLAKDGWAARAKGLDIGVGSDGTAVGINEENGVYLYVPATKNKKASWKQMPGIKLTSIAVGNKDEMWGTFKDGDKIYLYHYEKGAWNRVKDQKGQDVTSFVQVSQSGKSIFALNADGGVVKYGMENVTPDLVKKVEAQVKKDAKKKETAWQATKAEIKKSQGKQQKHLASKRAKRLAKQQAKAGKTTTASSTPAQRKKIRTSNKSTKNKSTKPVKAKRTKIAGKKTKKVKATSKQTSDKSVEPADATTTDDTATGM
ncbi:hypothetical protein K2W90_06605, partial [Candidatus Babeliales bacterium]|nr:hypothetical protein [Candidatus Babeliales bacterium]